MGVVSDVLCQTAQRVHEDGLTFVSVMVGASDANPKGVGRVHKVALIFARHTEEVRDARGASLARNLVKVMDSVTRLLGERLGYVHHTVL